MKANYGYSDASGEYYISIVNDKCSDGCTKCVDACPENVFEIEIDDYDEPMARVRNEIIKDLKYTCGPCKPVDGSRELKCQLACPWGSINHAW